MYMAILALVNPGDEILIADPSYTNYVGEIVMNRAVAVPVPVYEKDNFNFTYENLKSRVTDKTKAIILNSPCNPTGLSLIHISLQFMPIMPTVPLLLRPIRITFIKILCCLLICEKSCI